MIFSTTPPVQISSLHGIKFKKTKITPNIRAPTTP